MQKIYLLIGCCFTLYYANAQSGTWSWQSGDNVPNKYGKYGSKGKFSVDFKPGSRTEAISWTDENGLFWLFGGQGNAEKSAGLLNDLWVYNPKDKTWAWMSGDSDANERGIYVQQGEANKKSKPGARFNAISWTDSEGSLWLFGGYGYASPNTELPGFLNDLWKYYPSKDVWVWIAGSNVNNDKGYFGRKHVSSKENMPCARMGSVSWIDASGTLWLHGGAGYDTKKFGDLNDLWKYEPGKNAWTWESGDNDVNVKGVYGIKGIPSVENKPGGRYNAVSWVEKSGILWLFGGMEITSKPENFRNDLWSYNTKTFKWTWVNGDNDPNQPGVYSGKGIFNEKNMPGSRGGAISWTDDSENFWLFGGKLFEKNEYAQNYTNDLWLYDKKVNQWSWVSGDHVPNQPGIYGSLGIASSANKPGSREGSISWIDNSGYLWLFGGDFLFREKEKNDLYNDLWKFELVSLSCPGNKTTATNIANCEAIVKGIDPIFKSAGDRNIYYTITGATKAGGKTTASGQTFYKGVSTVVYAVSTDTSQACSFTVTVKDETSPVPSIKTLPDIMEECAVKISSIPVAKDNCDGGIVASTSSPLFYEKKGTYFITWLFKDKSGNVDSQQQRVIIKDTTAPIPGVGALPDISAPCSVTITNFPVATDKCSGTIIGITNNPLSYKAKGIYTIEWIFKDPSGNTASQLQRVIINDSTAPIPSLKSLPDISAVCSVTINSFPTAIDNCSGTVTGATTSPLSYSAKGNYTIEWYYKDSSGNITTQQQHVTIIDSIAPLPTVKNLPDISGDCSVFVTAFPTATDNCDGRIIATTADPLTYYAQGDHTINWVFKDKSGNTVTQQQRVTITDKTPPVPTVKSLPDITGDCSTFIAPPTAMDNCSGLITGTTTSSLSSSGQGSFTVNWIYKDSSGNITTQQQKVSLTDRTAPVPSLRSLPDITADCSVKITVVPTAYDYCSGNITGFTNDPLSYTTQGTYTITWIYNDSSGNSAMQLQRVVVKDATVPVPDQKSLPAIYGDCSVTITKIPTATDNCIGITTATTSSPLYYSSPGIYSINWIYKDANGNTATQQQQVIVKDDTAPVPNLASLPDLNGDCSVMISNPPTATDNCSGRITATTTDPLSYTTQGNFSITWQFKDASGNTTLQKQRIIVKDNAPPVPDLAILPDITGECSAKAGVIPTATDNCSGKVAAVTNSALSYNTAGAFTIEWIFKDASGNTSTQQQKVIVKDKTPPVPDAPTLPVITGECRATASLVPAATDNCSGFIKAVTNDPLTYSTPGSYTINWTYTDAAGNSSTQKQLVIIKTTSGPVPTTASLPDISGECSVTVSAKPTARDKCGNLVIATTTDPVFYTLPGKHIISWKYTDASGNITVQKQYVIVISLRLSINIFPNPTHNEFNVLVKSCDGSRIITLNVYDVMGRQVYTRVIKPYEPAKFGLGFQTGAYFIQVNQGPERLIQKLLKTR